MCSVLAVGCGYLRLLPGSGARASVCVRVVFHARFGLHSGGHPRPAPQVQEMPARLWVNAECMTNRVCMSGICMIKADAPEAAWYQGALGQVETSSRCVLQPGCGCMIHLFV